MDFKELINTNATIKKASQKTPLFWFSDKLLPFSEAAKTTSFSNDDICDAERRLLRFAPFVAAAFGETKAQNGLIESELRRIENAQKSLDSKYKKIEGKLFIKMDSHLPIAGSVKARGGIYAVLKHAETLAISCGILKEQDNYEILASPKMKEFFGNYSISVGSTGNLGISIGIASAVIGFKVVVHMSNDAKQWKKDLLRKMGVIVVEHKGNFSDAVAIGREQSLLDPNSFFVDDENSPDLFFGYSVAANRLNAQLKEQNIHISATNPLFVYLPCGVGGAPGGITFGLKHTFGDNVHCFFAEPTESPCMLLGMATSLHDKISVFDIGLSGKTIADGLAVSSPSAFVGKIINNMLNGALTFKDSDLAPLKALLFESENIFIEPSAAAAFAHYLLADELNNYIHTKNIIPQNITHIAWATGGMLAQKYE